MKISQVLRNALHQLIKPCPCCGSKDVYHKIIDRQTKQEVKNYSGELNDSHINEQVGCFTCGLNMERVTGCNIINQWNKRVPLT